MFNQKDYISKYNKNNYKLYQFRVKKTDKKIIDYLDTMDNRNNYIVSLLEKNINKEVYTIKQLKLIIKPILNKYGITNINLFGSYARGDATSNSDIDIYCDKGDIKTLVDQGILEEELENALNRKVDILFTTSELNEYFKKQIMEDMIKL